MKIVSIFNQKGGVGKSTTVINLAAYLALKNKKVLIIDMDPQGNSTSGIGIDKKNIDKSIYNVLTENTKMQDIIIKSELMDNLFIIPSTMELAGGEIELILKTNRENLLKDKILELDEKFDFLLIDCPPSLGILTVNALTASQSVLIPIQCEFYALEGLAHLVNTYRLIKNSLNNKLEIEGVLLTMYDNRNRLCNDVATEIENYFEDKVYKTKVPRNIKLAESPSHGLPIVLYDRRCKGALAYEELVKEFLKNNKKSRG